MQTDSIISAIVHFKGKCMFRGYPLRIAHGKGSPTGPGGGAPQGVQCPNPAGMVPGHERWLMLALSDANFTLGS